MVWNPVSNAHSWAPLRLMVSESQRAGPRNLNFNQMAQVPGVHITDGEELA